MSFPQTMQPGDLAFVRGAGLLAWLVRTCSHADVAHVRIIVSTQGRTVEAVTGGIVYGQVEPGDIIVRVPYESVVRQYAAVTYADKQVGTEYSYLSWPSDLLGYAGLPWYFGDVRDRNCAELALRVIQVGGQLDDMEFERIAPGDLLERLVPLSPHIWVV